MALGNAYCDPLNQLDYVVVMLYQHGLLDGSELKEFQKTRLIFLLQSGVNIGYKRTF